MALEIKSVPPIQRKKKINRRNSSTSLEAHIRDVINRFVRTGNVDKGKSPARPSVSEKVVDDLRRPEQNPQTSLTRFPQQSGVLFAT